MCADGARAPRLCARGRTAWFSMMAEQLARDRRGRNAAREKNKSADVTVRLDGHFDVLTRENGTGRSSVIEKTLGAVLPNWVGAGLGSRLSHTSSFRVGTALFL